MKMSNSNSYFNKTLLFLIPRHRKFKPFEVDFGNFETNNTLIKNNEWQSNHKNILSAA